MYLTLLTNSFRLLSLWGRIIYLSNSASAKLITHNCNTGLLLDFQYFDSCWSSRPWWFNSSVWNCGWRHNIIESTRMDHLDLHGGDELLLAHYPVSRLVFLLNMASCHFGLFLSHKSPIFGPTWTWNDTWMGHKSAQNIFPHCLGCVLAHYPVSRLIFLLNMASCHFGCFWPKKHPFSDPPGPGITPGWGIKVPNTSIIIAWGVFWPIIQFPGWFFRSIWHPVILAVFYPQNHPFSDPPGPGMTPGWGIKVSNTSFPIAWGVFWPIFQFPDGLLVWYGSLASWSILTLKRGIFGRPLTWNGTRRGAKWPQTTLPYI